MPSSRKTGSGSESKRPFSAGGAAFILGDWTRLSEAKLADEYKPLPEIGSSYRLVVATTWDKPIADWWRREEGAPPPGSKAVWRALREE